MKTTSIIPSPIDDKTFKTCINCTSAVMTLYPYLHVISEICDDQELTELVEQYKRVTSKLFDDPKEVISIYEEKERNFTTKQSQ